MTWNELNERTDELFFNTLDEIDFIDNNGDEPIWECDAIKSIIECLKQEQYPTDGFGRLTDNHAEYLENEMLIKELENVR